jgi:predicted metalloprotease with PDZ domain
MRGLKSGLSIAGIALLVGTLFAGTFCAEPAMAEEPKFWCPAEGVSYGVSLKRAAEHIVHVDAVTHQPATEFQLPVWNALYQVRDFAVHVQRVKAYEGVPEWLCDLCDTGDARAEKRNKTTWKVTSSGDHPCITFSYDIMANDPGPFGTSVDSEHGFFNWAEVLVYRPDQRNAPVSVRMMDVPSGWKMRDGGVFGARGAEEIASTSESTLSNTLSNNQATAPSYDRLVDSPAMLGKLYESTFEQDGGSYHVVIDSAEVDLQGLQNVLKKIAGAGVDWMRDRPFDEYTFLFLVAHGSGSGGMEHAYSTVIDVSAESLKQDVTSASRVSAHEFFHLWNVKRIRPQSLEPIDYTREQYSRALWFSEGVTSTAADILLMRAGLSDEKRSLTHLATVIAGLQSRSARLTQSVEESSMDTWFDGYAGYHRADRSISYYAKGEILGFLIDLEMRRLTKGQRCLRDLFQYMNQRYAKRGSYFEDSEGVRLALEALTGSDFLEFFSRYVSGTEELPYAQHFSYVGLSLEHRQSEQADAGFSSARTAGKGTTIVRVDENSAAARLHLAVGDTIVEADGKEVTGDFNQIVQKHDPKTSMHLKIGTVTGETREVDLPLSTRKIDEYQFEDLSGVSAADRSRRAAFLRGEAEMVAQ